MPKGDKYQRSQIYKRKKKITDFIGALSSTLKINKNHCTRVNKTPAGMDISWRNARPIRKTTLARLSPIKVTLQNSNGRELHGNKKNIFPRRHCNNRVLETLLTINKYVRLRS